MIGELERNSRICAQQVREIRVENGRSTHIAAIPVIVANCKRRSPVLRSPFTAEARHDRMTGSGRHGFGGHAPWPAALRIDLVFFMTTVAGRRSACRRMDTGSDHMSSSPARWFRR